MMVEMICLKNNRKDHQLLIYGMKKMKSDKDLFEDLFEV